MNYNDLFKTIVKAYYENHFEEVVNKLLQTNEDDKEHVSKVIAALCGVEVNASNTSYAAELKKAIMNYTANHKVVTKIKPCSLNCSVSEGKTSCQNACHFDAIVIDEEKHTTFIDNEKCTDCGFCVDACPNNCFMDKVEFMPLINSL
jgi:Na+-translocating ferredoxin:NAD+ oxidoreductase RNF subunit RnfB